MSPNPEAIAWYLQRSETLLSDLRERVQALRVRGSQIAGFSGAVLALAAANAESILDALNGPSRAWAGGSLLLGAVSLIVSLVLALRGTPIPRSVSDVSVEEVANYATDRFAGEPDLWRVHLRMIRTLVRMIESTTRQCDDAAQAVRLAENFFLVGLFLVGLALGTLVIVATI